MIQGKFCLKTNEILQPFVNVTPGFQLSIFPLMLGGKVKLQVRGKKHKSEHFSLWGSSPTFRFGPAKTSSVPIPAPDLTDPIFLSSPRWWLGCDGSFWHLFCKVGIVVSPLQVHRAEVFCPFPFSHPAGSDRAGTVLLAGILLWAFGAGVWKLLHGDESDSWNISAHLFQISVTFETHGEIVLQVGEFVLSYFIISLSFSGQIRGQAFSNLIFFSCRVLQSLSDQATDVLGMN